MFVKLLKHEWNSNVKLFSILSLCALGIGCLCGIVSRIMENLTQNNNNDNLVLLSIPAAIFIFFGMLAIALYASAVWFLLLYRFYKSRFTDQGYLTFTLPVKTWHIFMSSALNLLFWGCISAVVLIASYSIFGIITSYESFINGFEDIRFIFSMLFAEITTDNVLVFIFYGLSALVYGIISPLFAIVLGCTIAKKHKIIATIAIMYGMSIVTSILNGIVTTVIYIVSFEAINNGMNEYTYLNTQYILMSIIILGLTAIMYPLSIHLMKNKLNLP